MGQTMKKVYIGLKCGPVGRLELEKLQKERGSSSHEGTVGLGSQDGSLRIVVFPMLQGCPSRPPRVQLNFQVGDHKAC